MSAPAVASAGPGGQSPPVRPRPKALALFVLVGALLGALLGIGLALLQPQVYRANAVISVAPPSQVFDDAARAAQDDVTALVQSELIVLSGPTLRQDIQRLAGPGSPVSFSAAQVGTSTIVNIDVEAPTSARALEGAEAVVAAYSANRSERLRREVERAAGVVDSELSRLEQDLEAETIGAAALQQEYGRLLAVRSGLFRAAANADQAVTVVQPPVLTGDGLSAMSRYGALGALLGALAGAGLLMLITRRRRGVRAWDDLGEAGVPVVQPEVVAFHGPIRDFTGPQAAAGDMRLLVSQLVPTGDSGLLVLFGATPGVGTSFTAAAASVCLSERADVLLVLAADVVEDADGTGAVELGAVRAPLGLSTLPDAPLTADDVLGAASGTGVRGVSVLARGPGPTDGVLLRQLFRNGLIDACVATGRIVVIDAPALCDSTTTVDLAERAGGAALVVGRAVTTRTDVETVRQTFDRQQIPLLGAVVNRPSRVSQPAGVAVSSPGAKLDAPRPDRPDTSERAPAPAAAAAAPGHSLGADRGGAGDRPAAAVDRAPEPAPAASPDHAVPAGLTAPAPEGPPAPGPTPPPGSGPGDLAPVAASPLEQDWPWKDDRLAEPTFSALATDLPTDLAPQPTAADPATPAAETPVEPGESPAEPPAPVDDLALVDPLATDEPVTEPVGEPADAGAAPDAGAPVGWPKGTDDSAAGSALIGWPASKPAAEEPSPSRGWFSRPKT